MAARITVHSSRKKPIKQEEEEDEEDWVDEEEVDFHDEAGIDVKDFPGRQGRRESSPLYRSLGLENEIPRGPPRPRGPTPAAPDTAPNDSLVMSFLRDMTATMRGIKQEIGSLATKVHDMETRPIATTAPVSQQAVVSSAPTLYAAAPMIANISAKVVEAPDKKRDLLHYVHNGMRLDSLYLASPPGKQHHSPYAIRSITDFAARSDIEPYDPIALGFASGVRYDGVVSLITNAHCKGLHHFQLSSVIKLDTLVSKSSLAARSAAPESESDLDMTELRVEDNKLITASRSSSTAPKSYPIANVEVLIKTIHMMLAILAALYPLAGSDTGSNRRCTVGSPSHLYFVIVEVLRRKVQRLANPGTAADAKHLAARIDSSVADYISSISVQLSLYPMSPTEFTESHRLNMASVCHTVSSSVLNPLVTYIQNYQFSVDSNPPSQPGTPAPHLQVSLCVVC